MSSTTKPASHHFKPIRITVDQLTFPRKYKRKPLVILNALDTQIEDGGDSPDVNRHLLAVLCEGVIHQVGEKKARPVLARIRDFRRAENNRSH